MWELRFPRVVLGGLVGGMLALAGASYQGVFRNPLADPYLLGVAAGAGLGATLVIATAPAARRGRPAARGVRRRRRRGGRRVPDRPLGRRRRTTATLILAGVTVAAFFTAVQTFVQQRATER